MKPQNRIALLISAIFALICSLATPVSALEVKTLPYEQRIQHRSDLLVIVTHADITGTTTNATAQTLGLFTVGSKVAVRMTKAVLKTQFEKVGTTGYNSLLLEVGDDGDTDRFGTSFQVNDNGTEILQKIGTGTLHPYTASNYVDLLITPQSGYSGGELDAGEIWLYFEVHKDN